MYNFESKQAISSNWSIFTLKGGIFLLPISCSYVNIFTPLVSSPNLLASVGVSSLFAVWTKASQNPKKQMIHIGHGILVLK